jgi:hypothetical protein
MGKLRQFFRQCVNFLALRQFLRHCVNFFGDDFSRQMSLTRENRFFQVDDMLREEIIDYAMISGDDADELVIQTFINFNYQVLGLFGGNCKIFFGSATPCAFPPPRPSIFSDYSFWSTALLTRMTGISLHMQWPLTSQTIVRFTHINLRPVLQKGCQIFLTQ